MKNVARRIQCKHNIIRSSLKSNHQNDMINLVPNEIICLSPMRLYKIVDLMFMRKQAIFIPQ